MALLLSLVVLSGSPLAADRQELVERATDPETGAFPRGFFLGPGVFYKSEPYVSSDSTPIVAPVVYYSGKRCSIFVKKAGCTLVERGFFSLEALADLRTDDYEDNDGRFLDGMDDRNVSIDVGLGVELHTPVGDFEGQILHDALSNHDGMEITLGWSVPIVLERWVLRFAAEHRWKDEDLADYYFGVEPDEALPGRPAYEVGSTNGWSVNVLTNHRISKRWLGILLADYEWYSSDIEDSPIVDDPGQIRALIGAAYRFTKK